MYVNSLNKSVKRLYTKLYKKRWCIQIKKDSRGGEGGGILTRDSHHSSSVTYLVAYCKVGHVFSFLWTSLNLIELRMNDNEIVWIGLFTFSCLVTGF